MLASLAEKPRHPYEIAATLRHRHVDESIKLNYGSLYTVVEALQKHRLVEVQEAEREGKRPERTVYRITDAGRLEFVDWLSELLSVPVKEYTAFEAGLALMVGLPPEDAASLLRQRCVRLEMAIAHIRGDFATVAEIPRLFVIEHHYRLATREAELAWTRALADEVERGAVPGFEEWAQFHAAAQPQEERGDLVT